MFKKNRSKENIHNTFFSTILYNLLLFFLISYLYLSYLDTLNDDNMHIFYFLFLFTNYCAAKYYFSCNQKFNPIIKEKIPNFISILSGYLLNTGMWWVITQLMLIFYGKVEVLNQQELDKRFSELPSMEAAQILNTVVSAPILEEFIFRGLLLNAILYVGLRWKISKKKLLAFFVIISSLTFSFLHLSNNYLSFIGFGLSGLILATSYLVTGSIYVPIAIHGLNNISVALGIRNDFKGTSLFLLLIFTIALLEYFSKDENNFLNKIFIDTSKQDNSN